MYFRHFPVMLMRRRPRCQIRVKGKASTKSSTGDDQPRDDWPIQLCATDKRSAITGGNACRPDRSREAVKRPGYTGLAPTAPEMTKIDVLVISGMSSSVRTTPANTIEADQAVVSVAPDRRCPLPATAQTFLAANVGLPPDCQGGSCCRRIGDLRSRWSSVQDAAWSARGGQGTRSEEH